ncbi:MAG TPA: acyl carrier protein [Thermohalobaculum sp.]|nr:acyl carrier protein [Thermohalobaculum sp.]
MNTLNLDGDGDEIDYVREVEHSFGIKLRDEDLNGISTVGELFDLVLAASPSGPGSVCLSARAFRALRDASGAGRVRPSTPISAVKGNLTDKEWCRAMHDRTGLNFGLLHWYGPIGWAAWTLGTFLVLGPPILAWVYCHIAGIEGLLWLLIWPVAWLARPLFEFVPSRLDERIVTLGDLVRRAMGRNFARLREVSGSGNRSDIWMALCAVSREISGHDGPIDRDTTIIA